MFSGGEGGSCLAPAPGICIETCILSVARSVITVEVLTALCMTLLYEDYEVTSTQDPAQQTLIENTALHTLINPGA